MSLREAFDNIFQEEPKSEGGLLDWLQNGLLTDIPVGLGYGILSRNKEVDPLVGDMAGLLSSSDLQPGAKWSPTVAAPVLPGVEKFVDDAARAMVNFGMANEVQYLQPESTLGQIGEGVVRSLPYSAMSIAASLIPRAIGPAGLPLSALLTTLMESTSEQGDVFRELLRKGVDMDQAVKLAQQAGNENMGLLAATNFLEQAAMSGVGLNALRHPIRAAGKLGTTLRKAAGDAADMYTDYRRLKIPPAYMHMPAKAGVEAATAAASSVVPALTGLKLPPLLVNLPATAVPVAAKAGVEAAEKPLSIWVRGLMDMMGEGAEEGGQNYISNRATGEEGGYFLPIATGMASSLLHTGASHLIDRYGPKEWRPQEPEKGPKKSGADLVAEANAGRVQNDRVAKDVAADLPPLPNEKIVVERPTPRKLGQGEIYIQHKDGGQIMVVGKNEQIPDGYRQVNQKGELVNPVVPVSQGSDTLSHTGGKPADAVVPTDAQNPVTTGVTESVTDDPVAQEAASNLPSADPDTTPISEVKDQELLKDAVATLDQVQGVIVNEPVPDTSEQTTVTPKDAILTGDPFYGGKVVDVQDRNIYVNGKLKPRKIVTVEMPDKSTKILTLDPNDREQFPRLRTLAVGDDYRGGKVANVFEQSITINGKTERRTGVEVTLGNGERKKYIVPPDEVYQIVPLENFGLELIPDDLRAQAVYDLNRFLVASRQKAANEFYDTDIAEAGKDSNNDGWLARLKRNVKDEWTPLFDKYVHHLASLLPTRDQPAFIAAMKAKTDHYRELAAGHIDPLLRGVGEKIREYRDSGAQQAAEMKAKIAEQAAQAEEKNQRSDAIPINTENDLWAYVRKQDALINGDVTDDTYSFEDDLAQFFRADDRSLMDDSATVQQHDANIVSRAKRAAHSMKELQAWRNAHPTQSITGSLIDILRAAIDNTNLPSLDAKGARDRAIQRGMDASGLSKSVIAQALTNLSIHKKAMKKGAPGSFLGNMVRLQEMLDDLAKRQMAIENGAITDEKALEFEERKISDLEHKAREYAERAANTIATDPHAAAIGLVDWMRDLDATPAANQGPKLLPIELFRKELTAKREDLFTALQDIGNRKQENGMQPDLAFADKALKTLSAVTNSRPPVGAKSIWDIVGDPAYETSLDKIIEDGGNISGSILPNVDDSEATKSAKGIILERVREFVKASQRRMLDAYRKAHHGRRVESEFNHTPQGMALSGALRQLDEIENGRRGFANIADIAANPDLQIRANVKKHIVHKTKSLLPDDASADLRHALLLIKEGKTTHQYAQEQSPRGAQARAADDQHNANTDPNAPVNHIVSGMNDGKGWFTRYDPEERAGNKPVVEQPVESAPSETPLMDDAIEIDVAPESNTDNEWIASEDETLGILPSFKIPMPKIVRRLLSLFDPDMRHDTKFPTLRKEIQGFLGGAEQKMENTLRILREKTKDQSWWTPRAAREALQYGIFDPKMPQEVQDLVRQVQNDYDAVTALRNKWGIKSQQFASIGDMLNPLYRSDVDPEFAPTPIAIRDSISELMKLHGMDLATASATVADIIDGKVDPKTLRPKFLQNQTQNAAMMQRYGGIKQGVEHPLTMAMMGAVEDPLTLMYYNFRRHARWSAQQALVRATAQSVAQTANPMSKGTAIPHGWVPFEIPDSKGKPQPILAPGAIDPLYVPKPVMDDILAMHKAIKPTEAKMIMTIFKSAKIRWSATACMNNCIGNFFLGQIGGVSMVDQVREYPTAARELRQWVKEGKASPKLQEALDLGVLSGTMTEAELSMLGGTLDDVSRAKGFSGILKALYKVAHRASASKSYPLYEQIEMIHRYMLYRVVTTQGRMSTMQDIAAKGLRGNAKWKERLSGDKARDAVNDIVFDYEHDLPNYVKYLRGSVVPFISFPFLAGRSIAKNAVLRPHALLAAYGVGWALRAAVQAATGFELDLDNWIPFWDAADPEQRANTREVKSRAGNVAEKFIPGGPFVLPFEEAAGVKLSGYPLKGWGRDAAEMMLPAVAVNAYNQLENVYEKGTPLPLAALRTIGVRLRPTDNEQKRKDIYVLRKKITNELEKHWARGGGEKSAMYTQGRIDKILESMQSVLEQNQP